MEEFHRTIVISTLTAEIKRLQDGIRKHRDQKGDDRCWLDDWELYALLPEGIEGLDDRLPPKDQFLKNCERFHATRQCRADDPTRLVDPADLHRRGPDYVPEYTDDTDDNS